MKKFLFALICALGLCSCNLSELPRYSFQWDTYEPEMYGYVYAELIEYDAAGHEIYSTEIESVEFGRKYYYYGLSDACYVKVYVRYKYGRNEFAEWVPYVYDIFPGKSTEIYIDDSLRFLDYEPVI